MRPLITGCRVPFSREAWAELCALHGRFEDALHGRLPPPHADRIAGQVRELSAAYNSISPENPYSRPEWVQARVHFFLPTDLPKVWLPLTEAVPILRLGDARSLSVLDLGAGVGTAAAGMALLLEQQRFRGRLELTLVEPDPVVVRYVDPVMDTVRSAVSFRVEHRLEPFDMAGYLERRPDQRFDVVVLLNVAAEAFSAAQYVDGLHGLVRRLLAEKVKKGGLLVVVEPALKRFSRMLSEVAARHRQGGGEVWAPCVAAGTCPELARSDGFCFHSIPVPLSPVVQSISSRSGLKRHEVHFSYLSLLPKAKRMLESTPCGRAGQATASPSEGDTSGTSKEAGSIPGRVVSFPKRGGKGFTYWVCGPAGLLHAFAPPRIGGEDGIRGGRLPHGTIVEIALGEEAGRIG